MLLIILIFTSTLAILPEQAFAWGPATHLELSSYLLGHLLLLPPVIRSLLKRHPFAYLYGSVGADITLGKRFVEIDHHCHSWKVGFEILNHAANGPQTAFAWGYLSHLAADVVAHNEFLPRQLLSSYHYRFSRHIYWELRFDVTVHPEAWELSKHLMSLDHREHDELLETTLRRTIFSFKTNKRIFNGLMRIQQLEKIRKVAAKVSARSPLPLDQTTIERYKMRSLQSTIDVMRNGLDSPWVDRQPHGLTRLDYANELRRNLRDLARQGSVSPEMIQAMIAEVAPE